MLANIAQNYASLASFRIGARIMQFILKTYLIRQQLDVQIVGHMINLDIILTISIHFNKTCLKPSYQRVSDKISFQQSLKSALNTMTIGIFTTLFIASIISIFQITNYSAGVPHFQYAILFYAISAVFQAIQQKYNSQMTLKYQYKKSGIIEMCSFLPKTGFLFIAAKTGLLQTYGIAIFGISQLIYSSLFMLITFLTCSNKSMTIQKLSNGNYIDDKTKQMLKLLSIISVLKMVLSQIQKVILVIINISLLSSVYSLISNFGSIVVRYVFSPIEEIQYNYFSRGTAKDSLKTFQNITFGLLVFGILSLSYGYQYSQTVLLIVYGQRWTNNDSILALRVYTVLLCLMGINGTMEAFVFARAKPSTISTYKYYSVVSSILSVIGSLSFYQFGFGAASMFLGSILSMASRVVFAWFIQVKNHYQGKIGSLVRQIVPPISFVIVTLAFFFTIPHLKRHTPIINMFIGLCLFSINLLPILYFFRKQIKNVIVKYKTK